MIRYKLSFLITFFFLSLSSCKVTTGHETLTGNLHYQIFGLRSLYNLPDSVVKRIELRHKSLPDSIIAKDTLLSIIINRNLKNSPYIFLKRQDGEVATIYMEKYQYEQFTKFTHKELTDNKKKVVIKLKAEKLMDKYYKCISVKSVKVKKAKLWADKENFYFMSMNKVKKVLSFLVMKGLFFY